MRNIVFLYTEIAPYFLASCRALTKSHQVKVHIIRYPVNEEAPFRFNEANENIVLYDRKKYTAKQLSELVRSINPSVLICSGWIDKEYLRVCRSYYKKIATVLTLDTHWRGDLKQNIARLLSPFYLLNCFSEAWVPGDIQKKYALKLGFKEEQVKKGFYCCDTDHFSELYARTALGKRNSFPKRFIYVGRYYDFKGVPDLWKAFIELQNEQPNEWELWCLGTGTLKAAEHPQIKHFGFVQPNDYETYVKNTGVFVMPSLFEPWGVVLHEFATMAFPVIVSDKVGSAETFLKNGVNGFLFPAGDAAVLKEKLRTMMKMSSEQLTLMGEESRKLALQLTVDKWADAVMSFV